MRTKNELFVDTDVFTDHLTFKPKGASEESILVKTIGLFSSYTSVLNVSEVLAACPDRRTSDKALKAFFGISVLGIPYKYSVKIADVLREIKKKALTLAIGMP